MQHDASIRRAIWRREAGGELMSAIVWDVLLLTFASLRRILSRSNGMTLISSKTPTFSPTFADVFHCMTATSCAITTTLLCWRRWWRG